MIPHFPSVFIGTPLPPAAAKLLAENGFLPPYSPSPPAAPAAAPVVGLKPLTPVQGQIWQALTGRQLNERQVALLEIYWRARQAGEPPLSVDEAGRRLATTFGIEHKLACDFVKGSLRSFGAASFRRLNVRR